MENSQDELLRKPLYVYHLPAEILSTLSCAQPTLRNEAHAEHQAKEVVNIEQPLTELEGQNTCVLCKQTFNSSIEKRSHVKSDFHHYNIKQKLHGRNPVTEKEFEKLAETLEESLSGSDDSTDDEGSDADDSSLAALLRRHGRTPVSSHADPSSSELETTQPVNSPLLWLSSPKLPPNHYFGVYKALFSAEKPAAPSSLVDVIKSKQLEPIMLPKGPGKGDATLSPLVYKKPHIFLCMIGGGHFAAMVVSLVPHQNSKATTMNCEATVLAHKTFHKYTTRRKQGGAQSANDNAKGKAKSIGAQIRRANEQALADDIRSLLVEWKPLIASSELLFIRATGSQNRRVLFCQGPNQVLESKDTRLRGFPFSTGRATQKELMRCFIELTRLKVRVFVPQVPERKPIEALPKSGTSKLVKPVSERDEEKETAMLHTTQIQAMIKRSKLPALLAYFHNNNISPNFHFEPPENPGNIHAPTALHLASSQSAVVIVSGLLSKAGADPTIRNREGKTPFEVAGDRATRDAFRVSRFELGESKWDWRAAKVPAAMSRQDAEDRIKRDKDESELKRAAEATRLEDETFSSIPSSKIGKSAILESLKGPSWEVQSKGMTPEMRRRLEREQRARAAEERMKNMKLGGS